MWPCRWPSPSRPHDKVWCLCCSAPSCLPIGRRTNLFVPPSLSHETSWATSSITTFLRSALTFQVRKRVAVILREHLPADDFLPPPIQTPLTESDQGNLVHGRELPRLGGVTPCLPACCCFRGSSLVYFIYYGPGPHWGTVRKKMSPGKVCKSCVLRSIYTV